MYRTAVGLQRRGHRAWILSHPESRFTRTAPEDVKIIPKRLGMDFNPVMIGYLTALIRKLRVDLVVTNIQKEVIIGGLAARIAGIPNVRRIGNEDDLNDRVRWRQRYLVDHNIVPCDLTLKRARARLPWIDPDRFTTIHNGVDPVSHTAREVMEIRRGWGLSAGDTVIGCTSSLAKVKGIDGLVSAFGALRDEYPDTFLVLTGEGPQEAELRGLAGALGIDDRVIFAGFTMEPARVAAAYDICVLNSSIEGFPNVIIEYMAAARPVICTRVGGVTEIVTDRMNGLLIEPGDQEALAGGLRFLLDSPESREELGRRAHATVEEGFSERAMVDKVEALFMKIAAPRAR